MDFHRMPKERVAPDAGAANGDDLRGMGGNPRPSMTGWEVAGRANPNVLEPAANGAPRLKATFR